MKKQRGKQQNNTVTKHAKEQSNRITEPRVTVPSFADWPRLQASPCAGRGCGRPQEVLEEARRRCPRPLTPPPGVTAVFRNKILHVHGSAPVRVLFSRGGGDQDTCKPRGHSTRRASVCKALLQQIDIWTYGQFAYTLPGQAR